MGMFFEVIIVGVAAWWLARVAFRSWQERRAARSSASGSHDSGVWVNEVRWAQIIAELDDEPQRGDRRDP